MSTLQVYLSFFKGLDVFFFCITFRFWECWKRCDLCDSGSGNGILIFSLSRIHGESGVCFKSQLISRPLLRQLSARFVCTVCVGHEYAFPWRTRVHSFPSAFFVCCIYPTQCIRRATPQKIHGIGNKANETLGDAEQLREPRRAMSITVSGRPGGFAWPQRDASTLLRVTFLVGETTLPPVGAIQTNVPPQPTIP